MTRTRTTRSVYVRYFKLLSSCFTDIHVDESWAMRFAKECVAEVCARTLNTDSPSYSTIMELDRKVREFPISEPVADVVAAASGTMLSKPQTKDIGIAEEMGRYVMSNAREVSEST